MKHFLLVLLLAHFVTFSVFAKTADCLHEYGSSAHLYPEKVHSQIKVRLGDRAGAFDFPLAEIKELPRLPFLSADDKYVNYRTILITGLDENPLAVIEAYALDYFIYHYYMDSKVPIVDANGKNIGLLFNNGIIRDPGTRNDVFKMTLQIYGSSKPAVIHCDL